MIKKFLVCITTLFSSNILIAQNNFSLEYTIDVTFTKVAVQATFAGGS